MLATFFVTRLSVAFLFLINELWLHMQSAWNIPKFQKFSIFLKLIYLLRYSNENPEKFSWSSKNRKNLPFLVFFPTKMRHNFVVAHATSIKIGSITSLVIRSLIFQLYIDKFCIL
jgi:hypothetical protein